MFVNRLLGLYYGVKSTTTDKFNLICGTTIDLYFINKIEVCLLTYGYYSICICISLLL